MVRFARKVAVQRVGRRGAALIVLGLMYLLLGAANLITDSESLTARVTYAFPIWLTGSLDVWGGAFVAVGILSTITAFWPPGRDAWGFMIQAAASGVWATMGLLSMLVGGPRGWIIAAIFYTFMALVLIVSGMRGDHDDVA